MENALGVFTDGSVSDTVFNIDHSNGLMEEDLRNCGLHHSKYEIWRTAIYLACCRVTNWLRNFLESGEEEQARQVVVFSNTKSVAHTLQYMPGCGHEWTESR